MNDHIFISYKREDAEYARVLRQSLRAEGFSVWWDENLQAGERWAEKIDEALISSRSVVVIWTSNSVESDWVRHEASIAKIRGVLTHVVIGDSGVPAPFADIHAANLTEWNNQEDHPEFRELIKAIENTAPNERRSGWFNIKPLILGCSLGAFAMGFISMFAALDLEESAEINSRKLEVVEGQLQTREAELSSATVALEDTIEKLDSAKINNSSLKLQLQQSAAELGILSNREFPQRWLKVTGIEGASGIRGRIIVRVNGRAFSYPSRTVWAQLGKGMGYEEFPLPMDSEFYNVSFELLARTPDDKFKQYTSQEVRRINSWPFSDTYEINVVSNDQWGSTRALPDGSASPETHKFNSLSIKYLISISE